MTDQKIPLTPDQELDAELTAYLDGEVDQVTRESIEQKLSSQEAYRERLQALQASWDLLDQLPQAETDESFTRNTVTMAALQLRQTPVSGSLVSRFMADKPWLSMVVCIAAGLFVGYLSIAIPTRMVHRRAVKDLPLIENFEMYFYADSVEFLQLLDQENLFAEELDELL